VVSRVFSSASRIIQYNNGLRAGQSVFDSRQREENFLFSTASRPALRPTQTTIQWSPGALSLGLSGKDVKLTTHLQLVPRSRIHGAISLLSHASSRRGA
jgi:hypothetical protein